MKATPNIMHKWLEKSRSGGSFQDAHSPREQVLAKAVETLKSLVGDLLLENKLLKKAKKLAQQSKKPDSFIITGSPLSSVQKDVNFTRFFYFF